MWSVLSLPSPTIRPREQADLARYRSCVVRKCGFGLGDSRVEWPLVPWRLRCLLSDRSIVDMWVWQNCLWSLSLEAEFVIGCVVFGECFLVQWLVSSARNLWSIVVENAFAADALNILKSAVGSNFWIQFRFMFALQSVSNRVVKSRLTYRRCGQFCASTWVVGGVCYR